MNPIFDAVSVPDAFARVARNPSIAHRPALTVGETTLTYGELARQVDKLAGGLLAAGLERGAVVGILASRSAECVTALLGAMTAGGVACVLEHRLPPHALASRAAISRMRWLLTDGAHAAAASATVELARGTGLQMLSLALHGPTAALPGNLAPGDDALVLFTSGSTTAPKAVALTHRNLLANAAGVIERTGITPEDRLLHAMPLFHTNGINNQLLAPFLSGAAVILSERFDAGTFLASIAASRATYVTGVPTMFARLLDHPATHGALASLRFARCGSAPLAAELHQRIEAHLGVPLIVSYGLSEATCTSTMNPPAARRIGTVGTALARQQVAILAPGTEHRLAPGQEGEICIRGPALMQGYIDSDSNDGPNLSGGWLRTGDLGRLDADGYLTVTGRLKEIIIRGGENLSPAQIEAALLDHPTVQACCVVGAPDADLGEVPVAFVVAHPGQTPDAEELRRHVADVLPRTYTPRRVVFLESLPEIGVGKIDRKALRSLAARSK